MQRTSGREQESKRGGEQGRRRAREEESKGGGEQGRRRARGLEKARRPAELAPGSSVVTMRPVLL
jgi:hypothetical protein